MGEVEVAAGAYGRFKDRDHAGLMFGEELDQIMHATFRTEIDNQKKAGHQILSYFLPAHPELLDLDNGEFVVTDFFQIVTTSD